MVIMDAKDIQSDLRALKRLYGLLRNDRDDGIDSDLLDERSRLVLRNLLDAATKRVLKVHSEVVLQVIAGQVEASGTTSTLVQQRDESSEERPTPKSRLSSQSWEQGIKDTDKDVRKMDGFEKRFAQSLPSSGLQQREKRCRVCQRNTVKQVESTGEMHFYDDDVAALNSNRFTTDQQKNEPDGSLCNSERENKSSSSSLNNKSDESKSDKGRRRGPFVSNLDFGSEGTDISSSDRMVTAAEVEATSEAGEVDDCLSKQASEAIKRIELRVSALADQLHLFEKNYRVPETKSAAPPMATPTQNGNLPCQLSSERVVLDPLCDNPMYYWLPYLSSSQTSMLFQPRRGGPALQSDVSGESRESIEECKFPARKVNKIYGQNVQAIVNNVESGKRKMSPPKDGTCDSVALDPNKTTGHGTSWPATASKMESPHQSRVAMEDQRSRCRLCQTHKPSGSCMINFNRSEIIRPSADSCFNGSTLGASKIMGETKPSQLLVFHENESGTQHKHGTSRDRPMYTSALQHQESDSTATDSYSNWTSQQTSSRNSDSEEYPLTDETRSSGSWGSPPSRGTGSQYSSYTSNSEEEVYSSSSGEGAPQVTSSSSSKSEGYSSYEKPIISYARPAYMSKQSTPKKSGPSKIRKASGTNHKKHPGVWKRLKDRLAIIYHHHHHHHHGDRTNDQAKMSRNTSLDKHKGKAVNFKRQDEAYDDKAVEKTKKSVVHEKRQHSHFHGLMEGLLRHVRHSKQTKSGKGTVGHLAKDQHGRNKTLKKSHWWRLLQRHGGAKLPDKTHVKLGLGKEKSRLKALPNVK